MIIKRNAYKYVVDCEYKFYAYYCTQEFRFCNIHVAIFFQVITKYKLLIG